MDFLFTFLDSGMNKYLCLCVWVGGGWSHYQKFQSQNCGPVIGLCDTLVFNLCPISFLYLHSCFFVLSPLLIHDLYFMHF